MSITVISYHDHALIDRINARAQERAEAARLKAEQAAKSSETATTDFATVLDEAEQTYTNTQNNTSSDTNCPEDLNTIFEKAADTYNVSSDLLKSIAKAESNFNAGAVSSAGAVGIMQLMPATAASLGVTNSYDATQNIMGGAKYISQLLDKYNGNISYALAAYNAGSGNVEKYGGIPPFSETQNYVKKVLSYLDEGVVIPDSANTAVASSDLSDTTAEELTDMLSNFLSSKNVNSDTIELISALLNTVIAKSEEQSSDTDSEDSDLAASEYTVTNPSIEVRVLSPEEASNFSVAYTDTASGAERV